MRLNINTTGVTFLCTRAAEQRTDRDSGAVRIDKETGLPLWRVQVAALDTTGGEVLAVTVAGQPTVAVGSPVSVESLVAIPWSQGDRSGVAYRAASIRTGNSPTAPAGEPASGTSSERSSASK
ncbi:hypothetical protein [Lacisediminihabitans sp.]|jgi:hypothetical protein|uniref:hypothetical protein n=1 Tax=Lacisediminihabitans sp. TaxID=2787631 RepID=UPI002F940EDE